MGAGCGTQGKPAETANSFGDPKELPPGLRRWIFPSGESNSRDSLEGKGTRMRVDALDLLRDEYNGGDGGRVRLGKRRPKDPDGTDEGGGGDGTESRATDLGEGRENRSRRPQTHSRKPDENQKQPRLRRDDLPATLTGNNGQSTLWTSPSE